MLHSTVVVVVVVETVVDEVASGADVAVAADETLSVSSCCPWTDSEAEMGSATLAVLAVALLDMALSDTQNKTATRPATAPRRQYFQVAKRSTFASAPAGRGDLHSEACLLHVSKSAAKGNCCSTSTIAELCHKRVTQAGKRERNGALAG